MDAYFETAKVECRCREVKKASNSWKSRRMYPRTDFRIAVIVPCYNKEQSIAKVVHVSLRGKGNVVRRMFADAKRMFI